MKTTVFLAALAALVLTPCFQASAATLILDSKTRVDTGGGPAVNLTTQGTLDWAYFAALSNQTPGTYGPTNDKATGGTIISGLTASGGTVRGSSSSTTVTSETYSFTDGTSPTSGTGINAGGLLFNSATGDNAVGTGVSLTIGGDPATERLVTLYLGGFGATGVLTLSLNGATTIIDDPQTYAAISPKQMTVFTVRFQPDSAADRLNINWVTTAVIDADNGHVGIQAVTVAPAPVPEPSAVVLSLLSGGAVLGLWRRRR